VALVIGCTRSVGQKDAEEQANAMVQKAMRYVEQGDPDAAIEAYRDAIAQKPKMARAHFDLALLLQDHEKDFVGAIYHYRIYLKMRPETEKRPMIKERARYAGREYAAKVLAKERYAERLEELKAENRALRARIRELQGGPPGGVIAHQPGERPKTYRVQPGDNLTTIALRIYGDADKAEAIFEANKDKLRTMNDVPVGQDLVLP
jgi:nucleoid-associated protein YgaU